jgi:flagellar biosynthesis protein
MAPLRQAIALEYGSHTAPVVTAKAEDELAIEMIAQARQHGVYITEDPQLLALLSRLDIDQEVPPELFTAVAVILSWVYWLKGMRPGEEKNGDPKSAAGVAQPLAADDPQASL